MMPNTTRRGVLKMAGLGAGALLPAGVLAGPAVAADAPMPWSRPLPPEATSVKQRPVLMTSTEGLERGIEGIAARKEPFYRSWLQVEARAEAALARTPSPYFGPNQQQIYYLGREDGWDARALALTFLVTGESRYGDKAREFLAAWAAAADPSAGSGAAHGAGLNIGRILPSFGDAYVFMWDVMSRAERQAVVDWYLLMLEPVIRSQRIWESGSLPGAEPPWLGGQHFNNHLTGQNVALAAIGFVVRDQRIIQFAYNSPHNVRDAKENITGGIYMPADIGSGTEGDLHHLDPTLTQGAPMPEPGEIHDRHRMKDPRPAGLPYALLNLQFLTLLAEMAHNNRAGEDLYQFVGRQGENLLLSFEYYADYLIANDASIKSGYYTGSDVPIGEVSIYQVAYHHYPHSAKIREVLETVDRVGVPDSEHFNLFCGFTHGSDLNE